MGECFCGASKATEVGMRRLSVIGGVSSPAEDHISSSSSSSGAIGVNDAVLLIREEQRAGVQRALSRPAGRSVGQMKSTMICFATSRSPSRPPPPQSPPLN